MSPLSPRFLMLGLVVAVGCGLKPEPGPTPAFCAEYAGAFCDRETRCGRMASDARDDCLSAVFNSTCADATSSVAKGYQTFDAQRATACAAGFATASCELQPFAQATIDCQALFLPAVQTGGACVVSADCVNVAESCGGPGCAKTCQAAGQQGQPCGRYNTCATGRCDRKTSMCVPTGTVGSECAYGPNDCDAASTCDPTTFKCVALPMAGEACRKGAPFCTGSAFCSGTMCQQRSALGSPCFAFDSCESALFCDLSRTPDTCAPRKALGDSCVAGSDCQVGLRCASGLCSTPKTAGQACTQLDDCDALICDAALKACTKYVYDAKLGETCTDDALRCGIDLNCEGVAAGVAGTCAAQKLGAACSHGGLNCPRGSHCSASGTCTASTVGAPCYSPRQCQDSDFCSVDKCAPRKVRASPCGSNQECAGGLRCVPLPGGYQCGVQGGLGAPCAFSKILEGCLFPFECRNDKCQHAGAINESCLDGKCLSGGCNSETYVCGPRLPEGAKCNVLGGACQSGSCVNGTCTAVCT